VREELSVVLPTLTRLGATFPPLLAEIVGIFVQYGQVALSAPDVIDRRKRRRFRSGLDSVPHARVFLEFERFISQCIFSVNLV
jgi:hypothetical protein